MQPTLELTDSRVMFPILVWAITILGAVVAVTGFLFRNHFALQELEKNRAVDHAANLEAIRVVHAKLDAEATRLRIELEEAKRANREGEERSRERDEQLSRKIESINIGLVELRTKFHAHNGGKGSGEDE